MTVISDLRECRALHRPCSLLPASPSKGQFLASPQSKRHANRVWHPRGQASLLRARNESLDAPGLVDSTADEGPSTSGRQDNHERQWLGGGGGDRDIPYGFIAVAAAIGAGITGYLALEKLTGGEVACPASGSCETILSSGYATVFGIPLSLIGLIAYGAVGGLSAWQSLRPAGERRSWEKLGVLGGGTVLACTSACLLYLLATQFPGQSCTWCLTSAFLSFSIFFAACSGFAARELGELAAPGGATAAATVIFLSVAWSGVEAPQALADINIPYQETIVRRDSTPQAVALARRLKEAGAKMYGAFWCSHCQEQKVSFGAEAQKDLPYVECFPDGYKSGVQMAQECKAANLEGFPMWVINGKKYSGEQKFGQLEAALEKAQ